MNSLWEIEAVCDQFKGKITQIVKQLHQYGAYGLKHPSPTVYPKYNPQPPLGIDVPYVSAQAVSD